MVIFKLQVYVLLEVSDILVNKVNWVFELLCVVLLIYDMQEYFFNFWGENSVMMEKVVVNIVVLCDFCKQNGILVYYIVQLKEQSDEDCVLLNDMWGLGLICLLEQQQVIVVLVLDEDDIVLVKWCYSVFYCLLLEEMLKEIGCDQLIIIGVYVYIGCMIIVIDVFMCDIKLFFVVDVLVDFSCEEYLMVLKYVVGCFGWVVMIEELLLILVFKVVLCVLILLLFDEFDELLDDENLIDYGLDLVWMMVLVVCWCKVYGDIDFVMLVKNLIIDVWWVLFICEV